MAWCPRAPRAATGADCPTRRSTPAACAPHAHRRARPTQPRRHCPAVPPECARLQRPQSPRAAHRPPAVAHRSGPARPGTRTEAAPADRPGHWPQECPAQSPDRSGPPPWADRQAQGSR
ncbi:hypothetical protein G6F32_017102 [Rhizopus arrhizus]|nr:hypothetical protein G6F32_017102 [Rhizopus arrhizus]